MTVIAAIKFLFQHFKTSIKANIKTGRYHHLGFLLLLALLSLCPQQVVAKDDRQRAHFHHIHLKVDDRRDTIKFYQKVLGASEVKFRYRQPALFTEKSFILIDEHQSKPSSHLKTAIWHIGWGGVDGPNEYRWWQKQGVEFRTPATPLGADHYMYFYGPDRELIEIYTGDKHHRFNHIHLLSKRPKPTMRFYTKILNLPKPRNEAILIIDNVNLIIFPNSRQFRPSEQGETLIPTETSNIAHIAFSFRDLQQAFNRMTKQDFDIVAPIATNEQYGFKHFFVRGPDNVLLEFVEAKPIPEGLWDE